MHWLEITAHKKLPNITEHQFIKAEKTFTGQACRPIDLKIRIFKLSILWKVFYKIYQIFEAWNFMYSLIYYLIQILLNKLFT